MTSPRPGDRVRITCEGVVSYRDWRITYDPPPIPVRNCDWQFWHDDYDGARQCAVAPEPMATVRIFAREDARG
jgi:hypothetical protein